MLFPLWHFLLEFSTLSKLVLDPLATEDGVAGEDEGPNDIPNQHAENHRLVEAPDPPQSPRVVVVGLSARGGRGRPGQHRRPLLPKGAPGRASAAVGTRSRRPGDVCLLSLAELLHVRPQEGQAGMMQEDEEEADHDPEEDDVDGLGGGGGGRRGGDLGEDGGHDDEAGQRHRDAVAAKAKDTRLVLKELIPRE